MQPSSVALAVFLFTPLLYALSQSTSKKRYAANLLSVFVFDSGKEHTHDHAGILHEDD